MLYGTGDFVRLKRENGLLYYEGRCDSQIKVLDKVAKLFLGYMIILKSGVHTLWTVNDVTVKDIFTSFEGSFQLLKSLSIFCFLFVFWKN